MSLTDLGKNDISEETQALKDKLASRDTESAGLRTQLMRREAELEELQATLNETVYKLSKEAERALRLEKEVSTQSSELKTERISLRNTELALQSAQEKFKAEERAKKELESTLDTVSLHSQATSAEHQSVQREKRALESRIRELERIVQTHEAKGASNIPRKNGRPRSSSASSFRLPVMEQELNDTKAQLHNKDRSLRAMEQKLAQTQEGLVKAENARISVDKAGQKHISELLSTLERKEEELQSLREMDKTGEREEELLKRIDEDAAKIAALEKLAAESQADRASQVKIQRLQSQLKAECERTHRSEDLQSRLLHEKEELVELCGASQHEAAEGRELLLARERQIEELEAKHAHLLTELNTRPHNAPLSLDEHLQFQSRRPNGGQAFPDESALADHIQTLLQAIDRLRDERDGLKRVLEFSQVEYRITTESFQSQIASLTRQAAESGHDAATHKCDTYTEQKMKQLSSCAAALTVVISNLQTRLDLSEDRLSASFAKPASSSQLHDTHTPVDNQKQTLVTNLHEHDVFQRLDAMAKELSESEEERSRLYLRLADAETHVANVMERARASDIAREEVHESLLVAEQRFAALSKNCEDVESERNSLALQTANLQDDLARVQEDLADAENRYSSLHAQQLSAMSTSEVVRALKDRIKELEARIVHSSDQIADYQHDIRRLEANVKLHEERIAEMTSELELLASQKEAMVEDCAEAREARDEALEKLETTEEEAERLQQQLQRTKEAKETELSAMTSMMANLTSENQLTVARLANLETENTGLVRKLDSLSCNHHDLNKHLDDATSRSRLLELENSKAITEMQQAVLSLAVVHRAYKGCARRLQEPYQYTTFFPSQSEPLDQELEHKSAPLDAAEKEKHNLLQQLSDASTEELSSMCDASQQREMQQGDHDVSLLRDHLQEKELELVTARQLLEETESRHANVEAELLERIATMSMELQAQEGQAKDITRLQVELETIRTQLENSLENFADLDKLHGNVIQDFIAVKEAFEHRLTGIDEQIQTLEVDHQHSLAAMEAKYKDDADIFASDLEDREQEVDKLRQQLGDLLEAHTRAEGKLHEELKSYEVSRALANDLEKDLRRTICDMRQRLAQSEAEIHVLQEERQSLQTQTTSLHAEIQRSTSLVRYLESQFKESEEACVLLKESLQRSEVTLAESEKAGKAAEFNLTLQATQHEKVVTALRREIASLQSGPELRSALADLEEKNREMDNLLSVKCQEIEGYDDRILETLKANKKLTNKVESLTRKVQALQAKLALIKNQPQEPAEEAVLLAKASATSSPPVSGLAAVHAGSYSTSSHIRESSAHSLTSRSKTPEPRMQPVVAPPPSHTPGRTSEPSGCERSTGKKRPAPDDDERDTVPAEGHYSTDACLRNGPTPRLRRAHGHPAGFTPVRGATSRKPAELSSPGRRVNASVTPSEIITDVTNSPRGPSGQGLGDVQLKKRSWLGKIRNGTGSQPAGSRLGAFGGQ